MTMSRHFLAHMSRKWIFVTISKLSLCIARPLVWFWEARWIFSSNLLSIQQDPQKAPAHWRPAHQGCWNFVNTPVRKLSIHSKFFINYFPLDNVVMISEYLCLFKFIFHLFSHFFYLFVFSFPFSLNWNHWFVFLSFFL